jgi:predicted deacylase
MRMFQRVMIGLWLALVPPTALLASQEGDVFSVGPLSVARGQAVSGYLDVAPMGDEGARLPVSVVHGARPGPVLALIAGTHGYEYPGITALQRLRGELDPADVAGTLILVHIANPPAFYGRSIYLTPTDHKNLNRVYPGKPDGSLSERIADVITRQVIERADYLVDLHAGDGNEALRPYVYLPVTGDARLDAACRGMALAFGLDHIVIDAGRAQPAEASVYTDQTALSRGIPAITTETGQLGSNDDYWVDMALGGVQNLMRHLGMLPGEVRPNPGVVWLAGYEVIRSPVTGIFRPTVRDGYAVAEGGLLGRLVDAFGDPVSEVRAPFAGVVNYVLGTPPVSAGEPLAMVSKIVGEPGK